MKKILITGFMNKVFGNISHEMNLSVYKDEYRKYSLEESIELTEK